MDDKLVTIRNFCYGPDPASEAELARIKLEAECGGMGSGLIKIDIPIIPETRGQFTSLKDKNGREIYEGDILKKVGIGSATPIGAIAYHEERAAFIYNDGFNTLLFETPMEFMKIIGNLYENPELLK